MNVYLINILTISTYVWNVSSYMVYVVLYSLTYLSFFKISSWWVSIVIDVFSIVYFRFQNYRNTDGIFIFDNIESLPFPIKKYESESDEAFHQSFPTVFIPARGPTRCARQHRCIARVRTQTVCTPMEAHDDLACTLIPRVIGWVPLSVWLFHRSVS